MHRPIHEEVRVVRGQRSGLTIIIAVHSTTLGPAAGGCRLSMYTDWRDGLEDALKLSEAMTLKCAIAGLPHGGAKSVIALPTGYELDAANRRAVMLDLGDAIEAFGGRYRAGEDVGTTALDMAVAHERTDYAYCLPESAGGTGEPSEPTAIGVHISLRATCAHLFGTADLTDRSFTVIGLGQVGGRLARLLAADGAQLTVTDIDQTKRALASEVGATWIELEDALSNETDVLVPAALGGILTPQSVPLLRCRAVVGPANNQLSDPEVAQLLDEQGVLWAPDFVVNGGGVLYSALIEMSGYTKQQALERVALIGATLQSTYQHAAAAGITPHDAAIELALARVQA